MAGSGAPFDPAWQTRRSALTLSDHDNGVCSVRRLCAPGATYHPGSLTGAGPAIASCAAPLPLNRGHTFMVTSLPFSADASLRA